MECSGLAESVRQLLRRRGFLRGGLEELLLAIDQRVDVVGGQLKSVAMRYSVRGARLNAVSAKYAAGIINVVGLRVAFACRDSLCLYVFGSFDVDAVCGTCCGAEKTGDAFFKSLLITMKNVDATIPGLKMYRLFRIVFGDGFAK